VELGQNIAKEDAPPQPHKPMSQSQGHGTDFYTVLGLSTTATEEDVRRAYRRLAVRWHPDKNPEDLAKAEQRFKEVSAAYEVLGDPVKRQQYDRVRLGASGPRGEASPWMEGFGDDLWEESGLWGPRFGSGRWAFRSPFDIFNEVFGGRGPWADMMRRPTRRGGMDYRPMHDDYFFSPFQTNHRFESLFNQLERHCNPAPRRETTEHIEIKIHGFSDNDSNSDSNDSNQEETVTESTKINAEEEGEEEEDDEALSEAIRLSLWLEEERKKNEEKLMEAEIAEAMRRSLAEMESLNSAMLVD